MAMGPNAAAAAAASAGIALPATEALAQAKSQKDIAWDKAPCRFCGTGCSVLVGTQNGRVVATQGDPDAPVNRGLNCIKGYFLSKIMYGQDRVQTPMLRKKNGKYDKDGDFAPGGTLVVNASELKTESPGLDLDLGLDLGGDKKEEPAPAKASA